MTIGERIKALRLKKNISQVDFADKINVSKQTLYKYENNIITNIPSDKIELMAQALNTTPAYLMGWEDGKTLSESLADNLKRLRSSLGVTLKRVSEYTGISIRNIISFEAGQITPRLNDLEKLAEAYNVSINELLSLPELSSDEKKEDFIFDAFYRNGYFIFNIQANGQDKICITNKKDIFEIDIETYNAFVSSIDTYISFSIANMLAKVEPIHRKINNLPNAAHERTDIEVTDEMLKHDNDIMDDDSEWE